MFGNGEIDLGSKETEVRDELDLGILEVSGRGGKWGYINTCQVEQWVPRL
jgi:hypothetical protein